MPTFDLQLDILIIGAGPAGASLAAFLGQNGLKGLGIAKDRATAYTPRAHGFNSFAFECLRDIGLEDEGLRLAIRGSPYLSMRYARSLIGEEYGRVRAWGESTNTTATLKEITPCEYVDLTQRHVEPLLIRYASHHNFDVRFSTELVGVERVEPSDSDGSVFICTIHDGILNQNFRIRTRYLFGADGGRSHVARTLGFKFNTTSGGPKACNVLLRADIAHLLPPERHAGLHWVVKPDRSLFPGVVGHLRMVRPYNEWVMVAFGAGGSNPFEGFTTESPELVACVRDFIGDDSIDVEILSIDPWAVRESVAETFSDPGANVFILGDAAHRHPPTYGLGSNTCIQDAYNLAWKVAYVEKGLAGKSLLESYNAERQPVGATLVRESNLQLRRNSELWEALGMAAPSPEEGKKQIDELSATSAAGVARRAKLHEALEGKRQESESLGVAYNQWYTSDAVYLDDEGGPRPVLQGDPIVEVQVSTYPGSRLPHVWLDISTRGRSISTHDLAGKGAFTLFVGVGGDPWRTAAKNIKNATAIPINVYGIGFGLNYIDPFRDWRKKRGVDEDGCVLVRPDRFVAWRSLKQSANCEEKLLYILNKVLSRDEL